MAINVSVQYITVGFSPTLYCLLTQCYYHWGNPLNAIRDFVFAAHDPT